MLARGRRIFVNKTALRRFGSIREIIGAHRFTGQRTAALIKRFKLQGLVEARALLGEFRRLQRATLRQQALRRGGTLRPQDIPISEGFFVRHGMTERFGYEVRIGIWDDAKGQIINARTEFVQSNTPLTNAELQNHADVQLKELFGTSPTLDKFLKKLNQDNIRSEIVAVFRRF